MTAPLRIAMWSGPRNISTAMMRAWENRGDCAVTDEPLYAAFLAATGIDHPARDEVIAAGETDVRKVVASLLGPVPGGKPDLVSEAHGAPPAAGDAARLDPGAHEPAADPRSGGGRFVVHQESRAT